MNRRTKIVVAGVATATVIAGGAAAAVAGRGDDGPIPGSARERAVQAALDHLGEGTATETETGDGGAAYAVEVRLPDGRQVEVALDDGFKVIGTEADDDGSGDADADDDDD